MANIKKIYKKSNDPVTSGSPPSDADIIEKNKRQYFRIDVEILVHITPISKDQCAVFCGYCHEREDDVPWDKMALQRVNISGGGISLLSKEPFDVGSSVGVYMILKGEDKSGFKVCGEVVRVEKIGNKYNVGVKFSCKRDFKREIIIRFVAQKEREFLAQKRVGWIY